MRRRTKAKDLQQVLTSLHNATHPKQSPTQCIPCIIFRLPIFSVVAVFTPAHWLIIRNRDIFWRGRFCFWRRKFVATTYTLSGLCDSPHLHLQGQIEVCNSAYFLCGRETLVVAMIGCCCIHLDNVWCCNAISNEFMSSVPSSIATHITYGRCVIESLYKIQKHDFSFFMITSIMEL